MRQRPQTDVAKAERERGGGISREFSHARFISSTDKCCELPRILPPPFERPGTFPVPVGAAAPQTISVYFCYRPRIAYRGRFVTARRVGVNAAPLGKVPHRPEN